MSEDDQTATLTGERFIIDTQKPSRKGLLRRGDDWFHLSQRHSTIKLRPVEGEALEPVVYNVSDASSRGKLEQEFSDAIFFSGWAIAEAREARARILNAVSATPPLSPDTGKTVIPVTKLRHFYETLRTFGTREVCLALVQAALRRPEDLVVLFAESRRHFSSYDNDDDFGDYEERRGGFDDRDDFAYALVRELLNKSWLGDEELAFDYVSRELSPLRIRNGRFSDGRDGRTSGAGGMDLLLKARRDGLPIIGEIKASSDTNLFVALIQTLTYAAEMTTLSQLRRLAHDRYGFSAQTGRGPLVDIYLFYEAGTDETLKREVITLADKLFSARDRRFAEVVRRIAFLRCDGVHGDAIHREHVAGTNQRDANRVGLAP